MRLFVGIEFPEEIVVALEAVQAELRGNCRRGRFKRRENFHITLKFLGEVPAADVPLFGPALAAAASSVGPFNVALGRLGQFGGGVPIRTVWVDAGGDTAALQALQGRVEREMAGCGFPPEQRAWRPHITLAQDVVPLPGAPPWSAYRVDREPFTVREFALMLSEEVDRRRVYTPIQRFPLQG
ncbi:RNA 2',3'-cyclic phosphodiesterase [Anaeroselena agilis]|uniref:RNA 2',3'-cyclic phosphodiesterase n=1 Tax=Anaeroselena agilis TaxID=3063788 RepID=A0ABU3NYP5_9FIRM|nr:RNA 2',3'-cyclic phosphodiesterase [Selenomonadales bacterium 4137-cl]